MFLVKRKKKKRKKVDGSVCACVCVCVKFTVKRIQGMYVKQTSPLATGVVVAYAYTLRLSLRDPRIL